MVGGRGYVLVVLATLLLCLPFAIATEDAGPFTAAPENVRTLQTGSADAYTIEFDLEAGALRGDRMVVLATFFGEDSGQLIGQLGILATNNRAIMIGRADYGSTAPTSYPEGPRPVWNIGEGDTAHVKVIINAAQDTIRYEIEGLSPYETTLDDGTAGIAAEGIRAEFGFDHDREDDGVIHEAVPTGWVYRSMSVTGGDDPGACVPMGGTMTEIISDPGFTPSSGDEDELIASGIDGPHDRVTVDLTVTPGPWRTDVTCTSTDRCEYMLFGLRRPEQPGHDTGYLLGAAVMDKGGAKEIIFFGRNEIGQGSGTYNSVKQSFTFQQGTTYTLHVEIDARDGTSSLTIEGGGQSKTLHNPIPYGDEHLTRLSVELGGTTQKGIHGEGPAVSPHGWSIDEVSVEAGIGGTTCNPGDGPDLPRADEGVPQPGGNGEPGNLLWYDGPHTIEDGVPLRLAVPPNPDGHGQITLSFHMDMGEWRDIDPETAVSGAHRIARLDNGCSGNMLFQYDARPPPGTDPGATLLKARGLAETALEPYLYETGTEYDVTITLDVMAEQITFVLEQGGAEVQRFTKTLNTESGNECTIQHTAEGLLLTLGANGDDTWNGIYAPNGWTFSDIRIDVTEAGAPTTEGADMTSDEGRLAFLAANMIRVAQDDDYTLDCGPSVEVFPLPPPDDFPGCALQYDDRIVFGFLGEGTDADTEILTLLQDPAYVSMIEDPADIDTEACDDDYQITELRFQECEDALPGSLTTYAYKDAFSGSTFLVVSEGSLDALTESTFEEIVAFFRGLFGLPTEGDGEITLPDASIPLRKFHHGYFSHVEDRDVAAAWFDHDAVITYAGFVSDLHLLTPEDGEYLLGDARQVISAELNDQSPEDVKTWRHLTAALRVSDEGGTPFPGDTCGNGVVGFDEQCEVGGSITCGDLNEFSPTPDTVVECNPPGSEAECRYDASVCQSSACMDTWVPPDDGGIDEGFCGSADGLVCRCGTALWNAVDGIYVDTSTLPAGSAANMLTSTGSENIPLACAAAVYVQSGDPSWFNEYYDWQLANDKHFGTEFFSRVYMYNIVGSNFVVLNEAKQRGHADLQAKSEDWFRATYAILSVGAVQNNFGPATGHVHGTLVNCRTDAYAGPSVVMPAPRSPVRGGQCSATWGANDLLLMKAAGYTGTTGAATREVFWHGLRFPVEFSGLAGKEDGPYPLSSTVFEPGDLGITAEDRQALRAMVEMSTYDEAAFNAIAQMVGEHKPVVPITWVRTSAGTASWWGVWEERTEATAEGHSPNGNKPPFFAMKMLSDGTMEFLHPNPQGSGPGAGGSSWREGNIVYAENDGTTESFDISDIMAGEMIYVAQWDETGLHRISLDGEPGACGVAVGSYEIRTLRDATGAPQIQVVYVGPPHIKEGTSYNICIEGSGSEAGTVTIDFGPHPQGVSNLPIYTRQKSSDGLQIKLNSLADRWVIESNPDYDPASSDQSPATQCWCPPGHDGQCADLHVEVPFTTPPASCDPGGDGTCTRSGQSCTTDEECCGYQMSRSYCDGVCVRIGPHGDPEFPQT